MNNLERKGQWHVLSQGDRWLKNDNLRQSVNEGETGGHFSSHQEMCQVWVINTKQYFYWKYNTNFTGYILYNKWSVL